MGINLKALLGIDFKKPLKSLLVLIEIAGKDKLKHEVTMALKNNLSTSRRSELAVKFEDIAKNLRLNNNMDAANDFVDILLSIKP